jgi:hypothetical protein
VSEPPVSERRTLPRSPRDDGWHLLLNMGLPELVVAAVRDFTVQGAGLVVAQPVAPGTEVTLFGNGATRPRPSGLAAEVRHAQALPDGSWLLGCRFARLLTVDDLDALR